MLERRNLWKTGQEGDLSKMNIGLIATATAAAAITTKSALSFNRFRLARLRPQVGVVSSPSLCFLVREKGHCASSCLKRDPVSTDKLRALLGGGGAVLHDAGSTALVLAGAYALVSTFNYFTRRNLIQQSLSRKLVHILSGLLFMASWPIFRWYPSERILLFFFKISASTGARYFASLVPLVNCIRLVVYGLSLATDQGLLKSVTREGKPEELLRGPLYYVLILILSALVFWRDSPVGVISVSMMCGGDGIADIMGRRFGSLKLPYNHQKSWAGSASMFVLGSFISIGMLYYFSSFGYFQLEWNWTVQRVALVSLVATLVESLPTNGVVDDNITVPIASMVTAMLSFGY